MKQLDIWTFNPRNGSLSGIISNDDRFEDNTFIITTEVKELNNNIVKTKSGTLYCLMNSYTSTLKEIKDYLNKGKVNMIDIITRDNHANLVAELVKNPEEIVDSLTPSKVNLIHAILGISGEAGELLDAIKKYTIYNKELDIDNVIEELGDLEFYMEQIRQELNITRDDTLLAVFDKLRKRYPSGYSDKHAQERLDKVGE